MDDRSRYFVYVWTREAPATSFNERLLDSGLAKLELPGGENAEWFEQFQAAELRAKQRGVGLWRNCPARGAFQ
jgi:endonuclease YncB( thermonuclease family)